MYLTSGAEARVRLEGTTIIKERVPKRYRLIELDNRIRKERTRAEARLLSEARRAGIPTPVIYDVDNYEIKMQYIDGTALKHVINDKLSEKLGELVGKLHMAEIIHGDLTTSNLMLFNNKIYMIDFGLAFINSGAEARGVDIHVLFQTFISSHHDHKALTDSFCKGYRQVFAEADEVIERVKQIEKRGRYA